MKKFLVSVPIPPSINHCYFYVRGRKIKSKQARDYEVILFKIIQDAMEEQNFKGYPEREKIVCNMTYYFPDNRRRDTHNTFKLLFDIVEDAGLYKDDRYVLPRVKDWTIDRENPRVELEFIC